mgnify:FL=1
MNREAVVALRSLSFRYGTASGSSWIVKDFDFTLRAEDRIALYGPNGCGKSTLLYLLAGLLPPGTGSRDAAANLHAGIVFQDYSRSLLNWYTVAENLELAIRSPRGSPSHEQAIEEVFGGPPPEWVSGALRKYPYELSGGQRQLVALLRALLDRPSVVFLDEPFASLDVGHKRLAVELLQRARRQESGWVVIAHELDDCLLAAERIIVVKGPPLSVARTVDVPLEWPRSYQALASSAVQAAREEVYEVLWDATANS